MIYLLISGAPNTGKTETVYRLAEQLRTRFSYSLKPGFAIPTAGRDFLCIMKGKNLHGRKRTVLINSSSDLPYSIAQLKKLLSENPDVDVIITSVRDGGDPMRTLLFTEMSIDSTSDIIIEVPLGKITRRNDLTTALDWYKSAIATLLNGLVRRSPLDL